MPVEGLLDHPEVSTFSALTFGMLVRILTHYWHSECRPLPEGADLRAVARAHPPTWKIWKPTILKVFADLKPELDRYYLARENKTDALSLSRMKSSVVRREQKMSRQLQAENTAPISALAIVPKRQQEKRAQAVAERAQSETGFVDA